MPDDTLATPHDHNKNNLRYVYVYLFICLFIYVYRWSFGVVLYEIFTVGMFRAIFVR